MCSGASIGNSTVSKPHFLNLENSRVLCVTNGDTNKNELIPNLMMNSVKSETYGKPAADSMPKSFRLAKRPAKDYRQSR
jgi:hypothetical protein